MVRWELDAETYEKYADELIRFATFLVGPTDAPDVLSSTVLRVLSSSPSSPVRNWRAYLFRAVLNEARTRHRRLSRHNRLLQSAAQRDATEMSEIHPEVVAAVSRLSPRQRAVVFLTYWDDLDPATVASLLDVSEGSVRRHLARARARLRRMLDD